jgi:hypothetical protein
VIKAVIHNEHAVVLERLQEETNKDEQLLKLKECILKSDWERNKKDKDISPYYHIRNELYVAEGQGFLSLLFCCYLAFETLFDHLFNHIIHCWEPVFLSQHLLSFSHSKVTHVVCIKRVYIEK